MKLRRKTIGVAASSLVVIAVGWALIWGAVHASSVRADAEALASYQEAKQQWTEATADLLSATRTWNAAVGDAHTAGAEGMALVAASAPELLADPATKDALQDALDELIAVAALSVDEGQLVAPQPEKAPTFPLPEKPDGRDALLASAAELERSAQELTPDTERLSDDVSDVEVATAAVDDAEFGLIASAHAHGSATPPPEMAEQGAKDAYLAAVAALQAPTDGADLVALVGNYQSSLAAAVSSHDAAVAAQASRSAGPSGPGVEPTYIGGILVVNKSYPLPSWFGDGLTGETVAAFEAMRAAAAAEGGHDLYISSGFRSYSSQTSIYNRYVAADGQAAADRHSARPGHSEHQSGLTFDLNCICEGFGSQADGIWVRDNAHRFGFVVRYPPGKEAITGYIWEPWHLRYLGAGVASELYASGLTLEEYLGIDSRYS